MKILGLDLAAVHGAGVVLVGDAIESFEFFTDRAGIGKMRGGTYIKPFRTEDRHARLMYRLGRVEIWIHSLVARVAPAFVAIEDYAVRESQGAHYLGEVGGVARMILWRKRIPFRLHDPQSLKMFAAHSGLASKEDVVDAVRERWGGDFSKFSTDRDTRTVEDLADATTLAKMAQTEALLRSGELALRDLHEKELRIFNRTTKTNPVNVLAREWIAREGEGR